MSDARAPDMVTVCLVFGPIALRWDRIGRFPSQITQFQFQLDTTPIAVDLARRSANPHAEARRADRE